MLQLTVLHRKPIKAARTLLEEMTSNNYHWSSERASLKRSGGKYGVNAMDLLSSKVGSLT